MNKIFLPFCLCISICITACQTAADEVRNEKPPVPATGLAVSAAIEPDEKLQQEPPGLVEHLKIRQVRALDPAVFTMIRPYTLDRSPVKLPREQVLD